MKSERQQNQESELIADKIENFLIELKKSLPQILSVVGLIVAGLLGWGIYASLRNSKAAQAWTALYFTDTTSSELTSIAEDFSGTQASLWARLIAGDSHLAKGIESVFTNRDLAEKHYENAIEDYQTVAKNASDGLIAARANWGLAQAQEGKGLREEAAKTYAKVSRLADADPAIQEEAKKRAAWLESAEGESFYVWFKENRAVPAVLPPGLPGEKPALPDKPSFEFESKSPAASDVTPTPTNSTDPPPAVSAPAEGTNVSTESPGASELPQADRPQ